MNPDLGKLYPYPFERLATLKTGITPPAGLAHIAMSIGEPRHSPPEFVLESLRHNLDSLDAYPAARGLAGLREAAVNWLSRRYTLATGQLDPEKHVLPLTGTREGLFSFAQAVIDRRENPLVLFPNPFYQIYEGAALLAGAEPWYLNTLEDDGFLPDLDAVPESVWRRCQLLLLCSPGNPTGAIMDIAYLQKAIELADRHNFILACDECYADIYLDEDAPPPSLLQACISSGRNDFKRCVVFHSLSKRSNLPGLRSGFVAGDADIIRQFLQYRTYHGCAAPLPVQIASVAAWNDDRHAADNRRLYQQKFALADKILRPVMDVTMPPAAFYLWPRTPLDDETFTKQLFASQNLTVLPGRYLSRPTPAGDPGLNRVRISLVPDIETCKDAMYRIRSFVEGL